jgi:hypothetical protein
MQPDAIKKQQKDNKWDIAQDIALTPENSV